MLEIIFKKLSEYNALVSGLAHASTFYLTTGGQSDSNEVALLEAKIGRSIPADLKEFYKSIGSIKSDPFNENNSIDIFCTQDLLAKLNSEETWDRIYSLGLLDMIKFSWGNDRPEIDELNPKLRKAINDRYICFGWFRKDENLESTNYLFFDENGKFGCVYYHQDDFTDFLEKYIFPMETDSIASDTFEDLLVHSMDMIINLKRTEIGK